MGAISGKYLRDEGIWKVYETTYADGSIGHTYVQKDNRWDDLPNVIKGPVKLRSRKSYIDRFVEMIRNKQPIEIYIAKSRQHGMNDLLQKLIEAELLRNIK